jgi:hypothetical protein
MLQALKFAAWWVVRYTDFAPAVLAKIKTKTQNATASTEKNTLLLVVFIFSSFRLSVRYEINGAS